jgi:hypothetical protein
MIQNSVHPLSSYSTLQYLKGSRERQSSTDFHLLVLHSPYPLYTYNWEDVELAKVYASKHLQISPYVQSIIHAPNSVLHNSMYQSLDW